jgi:AraC family transcriptional regulator
VRGVTTTSDDRTRTKWAATFPEGPAVSSTPTLLAGGTVFVFDQPAGRAPIRPSIRPGAHAVILIAAGSPHLRECEDDGALLYDRRAEPGDLLIGNSWCQKGAAHLVAWDVPHRAIAMLVNQETVDAACRSMDVDYATTAFDDHYLVRDPLLEQLARALGRELAEGFQHGSLYAEQLLLTAAAQLVRGYSHGRRPVPEHRGGVPKTRLRRVEELVRSRLGEELRLADLARAAGFSEYHFCRAFRRTMGVAPFEFVAQVRVDEAKRRLRETDATVLEIAMAVGYQSASHFAQAFRRQTGVTPTAYRRAHS